MTNLTSGVAGAARTDPSTPPAETDPGKILFNRCNYEDTEAFMDECRMFSLLNLT